MVRMNLPPMWRIWTKGGSTRALVLALQDQNAHHDRCGVRRAPAPDGVTSGHQLIDNLCQVSKVNVPGNDLQLVAQTFDLVLARSIGEEVELNGAARLRFAHREIVALVGVFPGGRWGFLEAPGC